MLLPSESYLDGTNHHAETDEQRDHDSLYQNPQAHKLVGTACLIVIGPRQIGDAEPQRDYQRRKRDVEACQSA